MTCVKVLPINQREFVNITLDDHSNLVLRFCDRHNKDNKIYTINRSAVKEFLDEFSDQVKIKRINQSPIQLSKNYIADIVRCLRKEGSFLFYKTINIASETILIGSLFSVELLPFFPFRAKVLSYFNKYFPIDD